MWRGIKRRTGYGTPDRKRSRSPAGTDVSVDDEQFNAADEYDAAQEGGLGIGMNTQQSEQVSAGPAPPTDILSDPRLNLTTGYEPKTSYDHLLKQNYGSIDDETFRKFLIWQKAQAEAIIQNTTPAQAVIPPAGFNTAGLPAPPYFVYQPAASIPPASFVSAGKPSFISQPAASIPPASVGSAGSPAGLPIYVSGLPTAPAAPQAFDMSTPRSFAQPVAVDSDRETFERNTIAQLLDLMKQQVSNQSEKRSDLGGTKHTVSVNTVKKIQYTGNIAKDSANFSQWQWTLETYLKQRTQYATEMLRTIDECVKQTMAHRESFSGHAEREMVNVNVNMFRSALSKKCLIDYDALSAELFALFPQHVQTRAEFLAKVQGRGIEAIDLFYHLSVDFKPRKATDFASVLESFIRDTAKPSKKNLIAWLLQFNSSLQLMTRDGYISDGDDFTRLYNMLFTSVEGLFEVGAKIDMRDFYRHNPIPAKRIDHEYMYKYFYQLLGVAREFFKDAVDAGQVHNVEAAATGKTKKDKPAKPADGGATNAPAKKPDTPAQEVNANSTVDTKKKDVKKPTSGGGGGNGNGGGGGGGNASKKDNKTKEYVPEADEEKKKRYLALATKRKEEGKNPPVCRGTFMLSTGCNCFGAFSHTAKDWSSFAEAMSKIQCTAETRNETGCKFRTVPPGSKLKPCPYMHKKPAEVHFLSSTVVEYDVLTTRTDEIHVVDDTGFLLDFCASTGVSPTTLDDTRSKSIVKTVHGTKTHDSGSMMISGVELPAVHIPNATAIVPGMPFVESMPEVEGVKFTKADGWSVQTRSNQSVPLGQSELGFPIVTPENVLLIKQFGNEMTKPVHALIQEPGLFREWDEMPTKTASTIMRALSKSSFVPKGTPSHFWSSSSGMDPPSGFNENVYDIETDAAKNVLLITHVNDVSTGPAFVCDRYKTRVYRVIYDWDTNVEKQVEHEAAPIRKGVAFVAFILAASVASLFTSGVELQQHAVNFVHTTISVPLDAHHAVFGVEEGDLATESDLEFLESLKEPSNVVDDSFCDLFEENDALEEPGNRKNRKEIRDATVERRKDALLKAGLDSATIHASMGHYPYDASCVTCALANQNRIPHSHKNNRSKILNNRFHFDTLGPVKPEGVSGERFAICGVHEKTGYKSVKVCASKHSGNAANALTEMREKVHQNPYGIVTANDTEYKGEFRTAVEQLPDYYVHEENSISQSYKVHHTRVPRYSPWRNGVAEKNVQDLSRIARSAMIEARAPASLWPVALCYAAEMSNILSGAWNVVNELPATDVPFVKAGPFGCVCTVVQESERTKFAAKSQKGFLAGFVFPDVYRIGFYENDKCKFVQSQNVTVIAGEKYFPDKQIDIEAGAKVFFEDLPGPADLENNVDLSGEADTAETEIIDWVLTSCCGKWRMVKGKGDIDAIKSDGVEVTCKEMGTSCRREQDPACEQGVMMLSVFPGSEDDNDLDLDFLHPHEIHKVAAVSRKKARSDDLFYGTEKTYKQVFQPAIDKERGVFDVHDSFDYTKPMLYKDWCNANPDGIVCHLNMILGVKNVEAENKEKPKARIVVFRETRARDKMKTTGIAEDESLRASNAGGFATRVFVAVELGQNKKLGMGDWTGAYPTAPKRDLVPVAAVLPIEMWPASWLEIYPSDAMVCAPVLKSLYGRMRAGYDFDYFARTSLERFGWRPLFDVEESLYVHDVGETDVIAPPQPTPAPLDDGAESRVTAGRRPPDGLLRYVDDTLFACDENTFDLRAQETASIFVQPPLVDPNGEKFVGSVLDYAVVEELAGGHKVFEISWSQCDLVNEVVEKYEKEHGEVRVRSTPAPSADGHVPRTREQEARDASNARPKSANVGKRAEDCQEYVGSFSYVEQHTRPDLTVANHTLQQSVSCWTDEEDVLLEWMIGYLKGSSEQKLTGRVCTKDFEDDTVRLVVQTDASHAGNRDDRLSTAGFAVYLEGPRTRILIAWGSKRLSTVALSSCESELFGVQHGSKHAIYAKLMVDALRGNISSILPRFGSYDVNEKTQGIKEVLQVDAQAAIKAIRNANSTKLRHVRRTLGISLAWLHKKWCNRSAEARMEHRVGTELSADAMTKNLSKGPLAYLKGLLGVGDGTEV